jgi:hypothetical protein
LIFAIGGGVRLSDVSSELLRERIMGLMSGQLTDAEVLKLVSDLINCGGGVTLELDEVRIKLIRREGRFVLKDMRRPSSSMPPRSSRRPPMDEG